MRLSAACLALVTTVAGATPCRAQQRQRLASLDEAAQASTILDARTGRDTLTVRLMREAEFEFLTRWLGAPRGGK